MDESAAVCSNCNTEMNAESSLSDEKLKSLADRVRINGIIWLIIGIAQLFCIYSIPLAIWNIWCAISNFRTAKRLPTYRVGLVGVYRPIVSPIINLILNFVLGAGFGVIGSLYYLIFVRGHVMSNQEYFNTLK